MDYLIGGDSNDKMNIFKKLAIAIFIFAVIFIIIWGTGYKFSTTFFSSIPIKIFFIVLIVGLLMTITVHYDPIKKI